MTHVVETRVVTPSPDHLREFTKISLFKYAKSLGLQIDRSHTKDSIIFELHSSDKARLSVQLGDGKGSQ